MPTYRLPEEDSGTLTIPSVSVSTLAETMTAYLVRGGTAIAIGTGSGVAADASISITYDVDVAGVEPGHIYDLEVRGSNGTTVLPNDTYPRMRVYIIPLVSIT